MLAIAATFAIPMTAMAQEADKAREEGQADAVAYDSAQSQVQGKAVVSDAKAIDAELVLTDVETLEGDVRVLEGEVDTLKGDVEALEAEVQAQDSLPQQLQQQMSEQEARKNAMRELSSTYADDSQSIPTTPQQNAAGAETSTAIPDAVFIPPSQKTSERMPRFEHHGVFRARLNAFGNYDLDTRGTSPVASPLNSSQRGGTQQEHIKGDGSDVHLGGNMRFRYSPTIHITESVRIVSSVDILDNFVMGTTPNGLRSNWGANNFFSFNGVEAVTGKSFGANLFALKSLYGEAETIVGTIRAGRIPSHWGMGLVYNDGGVFKRDEQILFGHGWNQIDSDSSDAIDRIEYQIRDPFFDTMYFTFSWDFVNSGLASYSLQQDSIGQSFDLAESDDVLQFTMSIFDRPMSQQEIDERYMTLFEKRDWVIDWGLLFSYRKQDQAPIPDTQATGTGSAATYELYEKGAEAYIVDLWARAYVPFPKEVMLRLEAEFAGAFGSVKLDEGPDGKKRDIIQIGIGLEAEVTWRDLVTGIKTGAAWAQNMVYSGHSIIEQLAEVPMGSIMRFDPNYQVDQIMFRELMGGINNAWYLNVYGEYKFPLEMPQMTMALGVSLDLTTSVALEKSATPGQSSWYGFEANAKLFYEESDRFRFEIGGGVFAPGSAWQHKPGSSYPILPSQSVYEDTSSDTFKAKVAWNVLANAYFMF